MDKFGIFNLLTSFYDFYQKNKGKNLQENNQPTPAPFNLDFLKPSNDNKPRQQAPVKNDRLYISMINTINSHDKIVKRVSEKTNSNPVR